MIPRSTVMLSKPKSCAKETQLSSKQLYLEKRTKQAGTSIEQYDKGIQNTVYMSKTEIDLRKCCGEVQGELDTGDHSQKNFKISR